MTTYMYSVICPTHGVVELSQKEYEDQLMHPDSLWKCPECRQVGQWNDDSLVNNPPNLCRNCGEETSDPELCNRCYRDAKGPFEFEDTAHD